MVDLRIGGTSLDFEGWYDKKSTLKHNAVEPVTGKVNTEARSASSSVTAFFRGAGYARNDTHTLETCSYDGTDCYSVKVMPTVNTISHN